MKRDLVEFCTSWWHLVTALFRVTPLSLVLHELHPWPVQGMGQERSSNGATEKKNSAFFLGLVVDLPLWKMMEFVNGVGMTSHIWNEKNVPNHQPAQWIRRKHCWGCSTGLGLQLGDIGEACPWQPEGTQADQLKKTTALWMCILTSNAWENHPPTKIAILGTSTGWWYTYPSETYESQLGWWHSQLNGKS